MSLRVGVDVGGTKVLGVLLDDGLGGVPIDGVAVRARVRLASLPGAVGVVGQVVTAVRELCAAAGVSPSDLAVVGLGVPGVVDPEAGTVTHAVNLGLIDPVDLGGTVAERLGVPVRVENDLNAAAVGAAALLGLPARDLAFLALGTGLAAGLLLDGRLRRGSSGAAGEIGHVPYRQDGPRCACGQRGCLEVYASGRALAGAWAARPADAAERGAGPEPARVVAAAEAGEPWAVEAYATFVDAVATAVRVLVLTCDIEHVVLGGGVAGLGGALLEPVRVALHGAGRRLAVPRLAADRRPRAARPAGVGPGCRGRSARCARRRDPGGPVEVVIDRPEVLAALAADAVESLVRRRPDAVLGLATGSSPLAVYDELARRHAAGLSFARVRGFLLDEYVGLPAGHPEGYRAVIEREVVQRLDVPGDAVQGPDGAADDLPAACVAYESAIAAAGGVDLQILGIGTDGHVAFNEPGSSLGSRTRVKTLTEQTRRDNARFFGGDVDAVPRHVLTQGLGTIMSARHLVLVASGRAKAEALHHMVEGAVTAMWPASVLQLHPHVTVLVDEAAASRLQLADYYRQTWVAKPAWQGL